MIGLLYRLIIGHFTQCHHKWGGDQMMTGLYQYGGGESVRVIQKCENCGEIKVTKLA